MYAQNLVEKAGSVISIDLVKDYLRIDSNDDDNVIDLVKSFAEVYVVRSSGIIISPCTFEIITDEVVQKKYIKVDAKPIISVTSVAANGNPLAVGVDYIVTNKKIELITPVRGIFNVTVVCGYQSVDEVPIELKTAILIQAAHHYDNRSGDNSAPTPKMVDMILTLYKRARL